MQHENMVMEQMVHKYYSTMTTETINTKFAHHISHTLSDY